MAYIQEYLDELEKQYDEKFETMLGEKFNSMNPNHYIHSLVFWINETKYASADVKKSFVDMKYRYFITCIEIIFYETTKKYIYEAVNKIVNRSKSCPIYENYNNLIILASYEQ